MAKGMRILIIDDSKSSLYLIQSMLHEIGYKNVTTSTSPSFAFKMVSDDPTRFSVVLTDLNMPNYDGMQVIKMLGKIGYRGGVAIISDADHKVINLAVEIARRHRVFLLGSIRKPALSEELKRLLERVSLREEKEFANQACIPRNDLISAISNRQIRAFYQPKINISDSGISGYEVLARVEHKKSRILLPWQFIPSAMKYGLINELFYELMNTALSEVQAKDKQINLSFNLSPLQLEETRLHIKLAEIVSSYDIDPKEITFEITEEHALSSLVQLETLNRLRIRGFRVSLDDFGTGFTNFKQLKKLPFSEVKIDRSLIKDIHRDTFSQTVVNSLYELAQCQKISLVAEGVEKSDEFEFLKGHYQKILIQGYLISKPKPLDKLLCWKKSWESIRS
ncbi:EAL domain-containing response regulator [Vibrio nigripulchritudo]|uniref:EAL domain-containing response regulator n=1 Tax=Vibrio nigripulchritudo TaxID=28173 RepID=UPI00248FD459|nr:EAL domain-containing response regulator [Vibrio nigripulchritudo]BDU37280.1 transcriptional regulator [Vibrio nigripulchritudo]BDU43000.1 transcriptional regulator [Vibrio nigripulchritudo]